MVWDSTDHMVGRCMYLGLYSDFTQAHRHSTLWLLPILVNGAVFSLPLALNPPNPASCLWFLHELCRPNFLALLEPHVIGGSVLKLSKKNFENFLY